MSGKSISRDLHEAASGAMNRIKDPGTTGTIRVDRGNAVCMLVSGADAETRTLAEPTAPGLFLLLGMAEDGGGTITTTVAGTINQTGNTTIAMADVTDAVLLVSIPLTETTFRWMVVVNDGATLG